MESQTGNYYCTGVPPGEGERVPQMADAIRVTERRVVPDACFRRTWSCALLCAKSISVEWEKCVLGLHGRGGEIEGTCR